MIAIVRYFTFFCLAASLLPTLGRAAEPPSTADSAAAFVAAQRAAGKKPNRLIQEKSPYLLKHAFNPVDWHPWGDEAFEEAKKQDKPVLLSIGYATCHWCDVMEEESFDNPATAQVINQHFVPVKVDREERPDVDEVYLAATIAMTGSGGWPMTLFLTTERKPFYAGTYFPPEAAYGKPGFVDLLNSIAEGWAKERGDLLSRADELLTRLRAREAAAAGGAEVSAPEILGKAYEEHGARFDAERGGFGRGAKFPRVVSLSFLLRHHVKHPDSQALAMVVKTLDAMARGGIRDHLGGGFHRYTVDRSWRTPHFEKMLADQAQLAVIYLEAHQATGNLLYLQVAEEILSFVGREMTGQEGGFFSALGADSQRPENPGERGEGAFYVWQSGEIDVLLGQNAELFKNTYGVQPQGNVGADPQKEFVGRNILFWADQGGLDLAKEKKLAAARQELFEARQARPRPYLDTKVLAGWNGLMASAFAKGFQVTGKPQYLEAARRSMDFVRLRLVDGKSSDLHRRWRDGEAGISGQLADYAFVVQALLDLFECEPDLAFLEAAQKLTDRALYLFADGAGGLHEIAAQGGVPLRPKPRSESAEPSGNSVMAHNLLRLHGLTGARNYRQAADTLLASFSGALQVAPAAMPQLLISLAAATEKPRQIVIAGPQGREDTEAMRRAVFRRFLPNAILLHADGGPAHSFLAKTSPALGAMQMLGNKATAYVCEEFACKMPVNELGALEKLLE